MVTENVLRTTKVIREYRNRKITVDKINEWYDTQERIDNMTLKRKKTELERKLNQKLESTKFKLFNITDMQRP